MWRRRRRGSIASHRSFDDDLDPAATEIATVTDALHNEIITKLRQQYLEFAQREALYSTRYGSNHLAVVNLRNQMQEIRHSIIDELKQIAETYKSDYDIAKAREDSLQKSLDASRCRIANDEQGAD